MAKTLVIIPVVTAMPTRIPDGHEECFPTVCSPILTNFIFLPTNYSLTLVTTASKFLVKNMNDNDFMNKCLAKKGFNYDCFSKSCP